MLKIRYISINLPNFKYFKALIVVNILRHTWPIKRANLFRSLNLSLFYERPKNDALTNDSSDRAYLPKEGKYAYFLIISSSFSLAFTSIEISSNA